MYIDPYAKTDAPRSERCSATPRRVPLAIDSEVKMQKLVEALTTGGFDVAFDHRSGQLVVWELGPQ